MSEREVERLGVLRQIVSKGLKQREAAYRLDLSTRQVRRLQKRLKEKGVKGLVSRRRGQASNNRLSGELKGRVLELVSVQYPDFGNTFACEKLREVHGLEVSVETLRNWRIATGQWRAKGRKELKIHPMRERRHRVGEVIQIDGSPHHWFEDRGPACTLLVFIDDATSDLVYLQFVPAETTVAYAAGIRQYVECFGCPVSIYSDRHSIFKVNLPEAVDTLGVTQVGRMLETLGIEHIHALSPQAKGRVERANQTLQDRLVKELRLAGVSTMEQANEWLAINGYIASHNARFGVAAKQAGDAHRPLQHTASELDLIFASQDRRVLSNNASCQYKNTTYQVTKPSLRHRKAPVTVCKESNGKVTLLYQSKPLPYICYPKGKPVAAPASSKDIHLRVEDAIKLQRLNPTWKPPVDHPWRKTITKVRHTAKKETKPWKNQRIVRKSGHFNFAETPDISTWG